MKFGALRLIDAVTTCAWVWVCVCVYVYLVMSLGEMNPAAGRGEDRKYVCVRL